MLKAADDVAAQIVDSVIPVLLLRAFITAACHVMPHNHLSHLILVLGRVGNSSRDVNFYERGGRYPESIEASVVWKHNKVWLIRAS